MSLTKAIGSSSKSQPHSSATVRKRKNIAPTIKQQPFTLKLGALEQQDILRDLTSPFIAKQYSALEKLGVKVDGDKVSFKDRDEGQTLVEEKITDDNRPVSDKKKVIEVDTGAIPMRWKKQCPLKIDFDHKPTHLDAGKLTIKNPDGKVVQFPLDAVGMPKPFGFERGSKEGGVAQGVGCQKNAFKRQLQLATAFAMGVSNDKLEHIAKTHRPIDNLIHDRGMDGAADVAVLTGQSKDAWDFANKQTDETLKNRLALTMRNEGRLPRIFFKKLLGSGQKPFEAKGGKLNQDRIIDELASMDNKKFSDVFHEYGAGALRERLEKTQPTI